MLRHLLLALAVLLSFAGMAAALEPAGPVLLTVDGAIAPSRDGRAVRLDREMMMSLGVETIHTTTIWTEGEQTFTGMPLVNLLDALGVSSGTLKAVAVNDYAVEIPVTDAVEGGPIIAWERNGSTMSVRDKGPLWLVYPFDSVPAYQSEVIYSRSIWQLDRITVEP
ncbi:molybdopterin-dependent oxidoreductase [Salipiger sp.]|uniref:molybdopterin-dependent oxidoreductase n=1 Tax=Salipiger sp. TaxID=2078585 RepID=UPI003A97A8AA